MSTADNPAFTRLPFIVAEVKNIKAERRKMSLM